MNDKRSILLISGGIEAVPIIAQARSMGLRVLVSDGNPEAPGFGLADEVIVASTYDAELTAALALESNTKQRIDGVLAAAADVPVTVAAVAATLGLEGPSKESAFLASDKLAMKERFQECAIPVPWFALVNDAEEVEGYQSRKEKKYVIKPVDSRGARGVIRLLPGVDPEWGFKEALFHSPTSRVMVEEWVEGRQVSTESIVTPEGIVTPGLSDRNYQYLDRFAPFVIEDGGDLPAELGTDELESIDSLMIDVASAFGVKRGTVKGDIIVTENGPVVVEAAIRLSGGYFASHTIPLSTGVNIVEAAIRLSLGEVFGLEQYTPVRSSNVCQRFLFPRPGTVTDVSINDSIYDEDALAMLKVYLKPGDVVSAVKSHPCRSGMVITTGADREKARSSASSILDRVKITIEENLHMEV